MSARAPVERLLCIADTFDDDMTLREKRRRERYINKLVTELFRDALIFKACNFQQALSAVYLSGLWHGTMLGPQAIAKIRGEAP